MDSFPQLVENIRALLRVIWLSFRPLTELATAADRPMVHYFHSAYRSHPLPTQGSVQKLHPSISRFVLSIKTLQRQPGRPEPAGAVAEGAAPNHQTLATLRQHPLLHLAPHRR